MPHIDAVWKRVIAHQGEYFYQIRGKEFTYSVNTSALTPSTTNRNLPKCDFESALAFVPLQNTVPLQNLQGPSYIYAILMDIRIRQTEW